jgi:hypothetical protein
MSTIWDWSPVTNAIGGLGQQYAWNKTLGSMFGQPADPNNPNSQATTGPLSGIPNAAAMMPLLKTLGPQAAAPLLLQMLTKQNEYDPTVQYDQNGRAYRVSKTDNMPHYIDGVTQRPNIEFVNGQAVDKNATKVGTVIPKQDAPEKPLINEASGQISYDNGKTWAPIPNFISRASAIANAKREDKPPNPNAPIQLVHPSVGY